MPNDDLQNLKLLRTPQLAKLLDCSPQTVMRMSKRGELPPPVKISSRYIRWIAADIAHFIKERSTNGIAFSQNH